MQKTIFYFLLIVTVFASCKSHDNDDGAVTITLSGERMPTNRIVKPVEWIILENTVDCFVGKVSRIIEAGGEINILEKEFQHCVLVFDENGKYLRRIGQRGGGSGEFARALDFAVDEQSGDVVILTDNSTVYRYDHDGNFKYSRKLDDSYLYNITHTSHGYVASTKHGTYREGDNAYLLYWFDDDFNFMGKAVDVLPYYLDLNIFGNLLKTVDGEAYYCDVYRGLIYRCTTPDDCDVALAYRYPKPMPLENYTGQEFFEEQYKYDSTYSIITLKDSAIILSSFAGNFDVALISYDGKILRQGEIPIPLSSFNGEGSTLLSPYSVETYYEMQQLFDLKPDIQPSPDDNLLLFRWRLTE